MIEATAIMIGTTAKNEAKTKASTISAPKPPITASRRTPGPSPPPVDCWRASKPVTCTGAPATVCPATAAFTSLAAFGLSPKLESGSGFG